MIRRLLVVLCGVLMLGGAGVAAAGEAGAAPLLSCSPNGNLRITGSGTSTLHMFYPYNCDQDPASAGVTDIAEYMRYEAVDGSADDLMFADRHLQGAAKTELTLCSHDGCSFPAAPPGSYHAILELLIFGNVANGDVHCHRVTVPGGAQPLDCIFTSGTATLG